MSDTEIDRMQVLRDFAAERITAGDAARLMRLTSRQVFRLAKAFGEFGPSALVSKRRGKPEQSLLSGDAASRGLGIDQGELC